ncbi:prepilin peptidase CpaA [Evansella vedderi]|uniref:Prepilin peptidase CpaA n=1 Tax=Evansella vedderi TaxID=38282 RepID=A0ABT9ZWZ2_9BACI|nr:A24 family peptidase [Evansella vedderi]MDQ0255750.1 prepilin peptidase CpaA [Evansella vedderi]
MINVVLAIVLLISLITDLMYRKIYNVITFPAILFGLTYHTWINGWEGFLFSGIGFVVGMLLLIIPFALGGMGAGDVKLLAAIGALTGTGFVFATFLYTCIAGGIMALLIILMRKRSKDLIMRIKNALTFKSINHMDDKELHHAFPYGVAIFIGTLCAYILGGS